MDKNNDELQELRAEVANLRRAVERLERLVSQIVAAAHRGRRDGITERGRAVR